MAHVTVTPETTPPEVLRAKLPYGMDDTVDVIFSEPVTPESAGNDENYSITPDIRVLGVILSVDGRKATLTTSPLSQDVEYRLSVDNILDTAATPNRGGGELPIVYRPLVPGLLCRRYTETLVFPERRYGDNTIDRSPFKTLESTTVESRIHRDIVVHPEQYSLIYDGVIRVPHPPGEAISGSYTFAIHSATPCRLYIDGTLVADDAAGDEGGRINLNYGPHRLALFFSQTKGHIQVLRVFWSGPGIKRQEIPEEVLFHQKQ
jgi:hypothetical protein